GAAETKRTSRTCAWTTSSSPGAGEPSLGTGDPSVAHESQASAASGIHEILRITGVASVRAPAWYRAVVGSRHRLVGARVARRGMRRLPPWYSVRRRPTRV